ncbi:MAG: GntR family transcriptional regulator [Sphingomicrobium sp.]
MQLAINMRRGNISDELVNVLRMMIVDGELGGGERINEVQIAERLAVSRTPLREALALLAREGTLTNVPRIGWFVKPLTVAEFDQLYAIRPLLDPEALRLAELPSPSRISKLEEVNDRILAASTPDEVIELDDEFHMLLIADCPNLVLVDLIRNFIRRTHRYEIGLVRDRGRVAIAHDNHRDILSALRSRDLDAAVAALRTNLQSGQEPIRAWLTSREKTA